MSVKQNKRNNGKSSFSFFRVVKIVDTIVVGVIGVLGAYMVYRILVANDGQTLLGASIFMFIVYLAMLVPLAILNLVYFPYFLWKERPTGKVKSMSYVIIAVAIILVIPLLFAFFHNYSIFAI